MTDAQIAKFLALRSAIKVASGDELDEVAEMLFARYLLLLGKLQIPEYAQVLPNT